MYMEKKIFFIQFMKFGLVGISNTIIALITYYLLLFIGVHYLIANFVSWIISVFNAFFWNNRYVFKNTGTWKTTLIKTYFSYGLSFLLGTSLLMIIVEWFEFSAFIAPLLILFITVPLNFFMNKFWAFK